MHTAVYWSPLRGAELASLTSSLIELLVLLRARARVHVIVALFESRAPVWTWSDPLQGRL
jgi:hypothetical protein